MKRARGSLTLEVFVAAMIFVFAFALGTLIEHLKHAEPPGNPVTAPCPEMVGYDMTHTRITSGTGQIVCLYSPQGRRK